MTMLRHAPGDWKPGHTRLRYNNPGGADDGATGVYVGDSQPLPGATGRGWLGVLVRFDGEQEPIDVDPADLTVVGETER